MCAADDNQYNMMICIIVAITTKRIAEQLEGTCEQQSARGSHRAAAFLFVLNEKEYFELSFVITLFGTTRRVFSFSSMIFDSEPAGQAHTMKTLLYLICILIYEKYIYTALAIWLREIYVSKMYWI